MEALEIITLFLQRVGILNLDTNLLMLSEILFTTLDDAHFVVIYVLYYSNTNSFSHWARNPSKYLLISNLTYLLVSFVLNLVIIFDWIQIFSMSIIHWITNISEHSAHWHSLCVRGICDCFCVFFYHQVSVLFCIFVTLVGSLLLLTPKTRSR